MSITNPFQVNTIPTTPIALASVDYRTVQILRQQGKLSRTVIAELIGYSPSKITGVVNNLLNQGIVAEQGDSTYTGGRRSKDLFFNPHYGYLLVVNISRNRLDIALVDFAEQVRVRRMLPISMAESPSSILQSMTDFVMERLHQFGIALDKVLGVGLSLPGAINRESGTPFDSGDLPGWGGYQIGSFLRECFPHSVVKVEKDTNAMAFAELRKGRGKGQQHMIYINVGQSVRAGLILKEQIYHGISGRAGDIGDVLLPDGQAFHSLNSLVDNLPLSNGRSLSAAALEGNAEALAVIEQSGQHIGQVLATMITLLDPQLILIGGRASALGHPFLAAIRRSVLAHSQLFSTEHLQVELAPLHDASLIGMIALTAESIFVPES